MLLKRGQPPAIPIARPPRKGASKSKKVPILTAAAKQERAVLKQTDSLLAKFNKKGGGGGLRGQVNARVTRIDYLIGNKKLLAKGKLQAKWVKILGETLEFFLRKSDAYWAATFRFAKRERASPEIIKQLEARKTLEQIGITQLCAKHIGPSTLGHS